jgi:S-adenosyl methyltransferase
VAYPLLDVTRPAVSRVHDCLLGGHENLEVDRAVAARLLELCPALPSVLADDRAFLGRVVTWAAGQGICQFLDIGAGFPRVPMLHEEARAVIPDARFVYADNDPLVVSHLNALCTYGVPGLDVARADLTDPAAVLADKALRSVIDLSEPVCALLGLVLAFLDTDRAREVVAGYVRQLAPGSIVAVSLPGSSDPGLWEKLRAGFTPALFSDHSPVMLYNHPAADVVEKTNRRLTAEEVLGLALALETSFISLLEPARVDDPITVPSGEPMLFETVHELIWGGAQYTVSWDGDVPHFPSEPPPRGHDREYSLPPPKVRRGKS